MRRRKRELIERIAATQLICTHYIDNYEALIKTAENLCQIAHLTCGRKGMEQILDILKGYTDILNSKAFNDEE